MNKHTLNHAFTAASLQTALYCSTVQEALNQATQTSRIDHAIFSVPSSTSDFPYIWCTLSGAWLSCYLRRSYHTCDAVARIGFSRSKPFFWSDLKLKWKEQAFMDESARYGIGPCGYSIPLIAAGGERALLSVSSRTMHQCDWSYYIKAIQHELRELAQTLHSRAMDEIRQETLRDGMNWNMHDTGAIHRLATTVHPV